MNFDVFIDYLRSERRSSAHTVSSYQLDLAQFASFCKSSFELEDPTLVTQSVVRTWLAHLVDEGYKSTSIHRKLSSLNAYFRYLLKFGKIQKSPVKGISKPKIPKRLPVYLEEDQMTRLSEEGLKGGDFNGIRNDLILQLFYETGIRLSELLQIQDRDVDFGLSQVKVLGKRNKTRYVPVGKIIIAKIRHYMDQRDELNLKHPEGYFFVGNKGQKISKSFVYSMVKTYLSTVTTQSKKSPHVLRHTFATHMLNNGADLNVIKEILGHSSLAATQVYTHNSIEKLRGVHLLHPRQK